MSTPSSDSGTFSWAEATFGDTTTGDERRTERLISVAARLAQAPTGRVTRLFPSAAERQGAYRLLENKAVLTDSLQESVGQASLRLGADEPFLFCATDQSSLSLADPSKSRELGPITHHRAKRRGLHVMSALALTPRGNPVGILAQQYWRRPAKKAQAANTRPFRERESSFWVDVAARCERLRQQTGGPPLWFLEDRGADSSEGMAVLAEGPNRFTIRVQKRSRRVWKAPQDPSKEELSGRCQQVQELLGKQVVLGTITVVLPATPERPARRAVLSLRACRVRLLMKHPEQEKKVLVELWVVWVRERQPPRGQERLEWMLWTNHPVKGFEDACLVVQGYTFRWRIEEFHKTWKSTVQVEKTLLRKQETITKFATIGAAVAARIERLKRAARQTPEVEATKELSRQEVDALILLRKPKGYRRGDTPTLGKCIEWAAELGGYTGRKNSRHPPGSQTIGRGFKKIAGVVAVLESLFEM